MSRPETAGQSTWAFSLGQRSLLGVGAVLAWMVLFHLLVNVWLLCVFTSLLVVLGGWLGSQVVLDSNSVIHLERFVTLEPLRNSPDSELKLVQEIRRTVRKITRDFVSSWYRTVSAEPEFEREAHDAMLAMAMELNKRARIVERKALTQRVLDLFGGHLQTYLRVREIAEEPGAEDRPSSERGLWNLYRTVTTPHPSLQSTAAEVKYARAVVDLLLHVLVPPPHLETRTGRFVVGELITCNVLLPLLSKVSDPDWLNLLIVSIFSKSGRPDTETAEAPTGWDTPLEPLDPISPTPPATAPNGTFTSVPTPTPELPMYDEVDAAEPFGQQNEEEEEEEPRLEVGSSQFPVAKCAEIPAHFLRPAKFNPFYQETDSDLESPSDFKRSSMESLVLVGTDEVLSDRLRECATPTDISSVGDLEEEQGYLAIGETASPQVLVSEGLTLPGLDKGMEAEGERGEWAGRGNPNGLSVAGPLLTSSPSAGVAALSPFSFEPLSSPEGPVVIQNLRITGTITAKEHRGTGSHPYTLYTIKYETAVDSENAGSLQPVAYHMVNRRYSEFLNLQTRLEERPDLRKILKNVKGPKKIFPDLPFGNMDSDKVEARKALLETFLKQLCAIPETANSEEMQEFLALNTDARIAFVKKPFIVSRIDKIVVNAIVDTLKTAFPRSEPQSPTDEVDGDSEGRPQSETKKIKSRLRFSSKITPVLSISNIQPKVLYCFNEASTVFSGLSLSGLEAFIKEQERLVCRTPVPQTDGAEGPLVERGGIAACADSESLWGLQEHGAVAETVLADVALNILCLLMKEQWAWLCTDNIQKSVRMLFGTLIDRWLDVGVANVTCTQYWVTYLRVLQEAVWPGGFLPAQPRPVRSPQQREETRLQSLHCLMKLIPDLISDLLGSDKYRSSWQTVLDSLQDPNINKHLVYCVCDLLLEVLVPESSDEDFQSSLLNSLSRNTDKPST
ncbi:sorting nexin-19 [Conger conger]|uniref:sorting nexin-19 n=1 Tax=Conger conger TaxID=82655 RepID=UPI002A5A2E38|nr:sorting nexin-19 [Conger conger]